MASRKEHCIECRERMGEEFDYVHAWLDGLACVMVESEKGLVPHLDMNHRRHRHHQEGIEEIRNMWGDDAAEAAKLHILTDFGYIPKKRDYKNEKQNLIKWKTIFGKDWTEGS